jgi:hypothetical protein
MMSELSDDDKRAVLQELLDCGYIMIPEWIAGIARDNPYVSATVKGQDVSYISTDTLNELHEERNEARTLARLIYRYFDNSSYYASSRYDERVAEWNLPDWIFEDE